MNLKVDNYLVAGCGRCPLGGTPDCKVNNWQAELKRLRTVVLRCGLNEELKWGVPCYTYESHNVLLVSALKDACTLSFMKGVLIKDDKGILEKPGENSQSARVIRFTSVQQIVKLEPVLRRYIRAAMDIEKKGLKVEFDAKSQLTIPEELQKRFDELPALRTAFFALTPGRQRGYILHFEAAKQSSTRASRIEKCIPQILAGKGFFDRE